MNLIVAVDNKWGIGRDGRLLAHVPGDMKFFREMTTGKVVVMGRKTLESMPGRKGLPNRVNYVLTRKRDYEADGCIIVHSEEELWKAMEQYEPDDIFLIGGADLYNALYSRCDKLYITKMDADLDADTFIVNIDADPNYVMVSESDAITENGISYRFTEYRKKHEQER